MQAPEIHRHLDAIWQPGAPTTMIREITIRPALNGYVVGVGCQTLVYTSSAQLVDDLTDYLANPEETEKRVLKTCFNRKHLRSNEPCEAVPTQTAEYIEGTSRI